MGKRNDGQPHRSPRAGSLWLEKRGDALVWRGRQTEKGKAPARASVTVPRGLVGVRLDAAVKKARGDCETLLKRRVAERDAGQAGPIDRELVTLREYANLWLTAAEHSERRASTVGVYRRLLTLHVLDVLGDLKLRDIRKEHIVRWWATVPTDPLRSQAHAVLAAVLRQAADDEYPVAASVLRVDRPAYTIPDQPHVTAAQINRLLAASPEPWRTAWLVVWSTACRAHELLGFVWADLDELGGAISLTHQRERYRDNRAPLKSRRQRRRISLGPDTLAVLKVHRQREQAAGRGQPDDWLFWRDDGLLLGYKELRLAYKRDLLAAKLPLSLKLHSLRHGSAQAMLDAGVDLDTVSRRLGHADVGTTSETYLRRSAPADAQAARKIERALKRSG